MLKIVVVDVAICWAAVVVLAKVIVLVDVVVPARGVVVLVGVLVNVTVVIVVTVEMLDLVGTGFLEVPPWRVLQRTLVLVESATANGDRSKAP